VTTSTIRDLSSRLPLSLMRLTRLMRYQQVEQSVTLTQLSALDTMGKNGPVSADELAACEWVQPSSMTQVVATLVARELVRRDAHPTDMRSAWIAITDARAELLESERRSRARRCRRWPGYRTVLGEPDRERGASPDAGFDDIAVAVEPRRVIQILLPAATSISIPVT
jgi:DNA-binding MarR family transcriptional regulator